MLRMIPRILPLCLSCLVFLIGTLAVVPRSLDADQIDTAYFVGNSLSWDILVARQVSRFTRDSNDQILRTSQHIRCGSSLTATLQNLDETCTPTGSSNFDIGKWSDAVSQPFDNLVLQPFYGATLQSEIDSIMSLVDSRRAMEGAGNNSRVFIYATWGTRDNFLETWTDHEATLGAGFVPSESTYSLLMNTLSANGYDATLIPAGHAFARAHRELQSSDLGNLTQGFDLYRDTIHSSNAGSFLAAATAYGAMYGQLPSENFVLSNSPTFSIAGRGFVADRDAGDELRRIASEALVISAVPEPGTGILAAVGGIFLACQRRRRRRTIESAGF